jgi:hypothetical protein
MRCSVMQTTCSPASSRETRLTAVGNSQVYRHLPVFTSHSFIVLSAEPETRYLDWAAESEKRRYGVRGDQYGVMKRQEVGAPSTSTVHTVPLCPSYVPSRSPLCVYQTLMRTSFETEKSKSPSLLNLI